MMQESRPLLIDRYSAWDYAYLIAEEAEGKRGRARVSVADREALLWNMVLFGELVHALDVDSYSAFSCDDPQFPFAKYIFALDADPPNDELHIRTTITERLKRKLNHPMNVENSTSSIATFYGDSPERIDCYYGLIFSDLAYKGIVNSEDDFRSLLDSHARHWEHYRENASYYNNESSYRSVVVTDKRILDLADSYLHISGLLETSWSTGLPCYNKYAYWHNLPMHIPSVDNGASEVVLKIYLDEAVYRPRMNTLEDAKRVYGDARLNDFRGVMLGWMNAVANGDSTAVARFKKEIKSAAKALKALGAVTTVSGIVSVVSLPISVAELMLSGGIFGLSATTIGFVLTEVCERLKQRSNWIMVGR